MQSTSSEAQVTQAGQAIVINNITCTQLIDLFSPMLGPHGTLKALVDGGQQLHLTKDGSSLCKDVQFTHPTSVLITRAATSLYASTGDGTISFILMCADTFNQSYKFYCDGTSVPLIINSLQLALTDALGFLRQNVIPLSDANLRGLALSSLRTKVRNPGFLVEIVMKALLNLSAGKTLDTDMIGIIKMEGVDIRDSIFVDGLVLDHSGRHYAMPTQMEDVCVMVPNMSLEYEKPEINAEFCYSSPSQREALAESEREFILEKARAIASFARELADAGKRLVLVNEKGIDIHSLELLAEAGVLALRRAKRRNLERLVKMCGGTIITQTSQIGRACLGYCQRVTVHDFGDNKYTFIEGTPMKGACTILLRSDTDYERLNRSIRGAVQSLFCAIQSKCCISGGMPLYKKIIEFLNGRLPSVHPADVVGYKVLIAVHENLIKTLLRNEGADINESMARLFRDDFTSEPVIENAKVVGNVLNNSVVTVINLLMCDEIIKAGKPVKQDKIEGQ